MALIKITFDGSSVSSRQDAEVNHHLGGLVPAGIIEGLGGEVAYSVSNNYINFKSGYVQIYGRRIYVEDGSSVYISLDADKYGYVIIEVNLAANTVNLTKVEGDTYPTLKQNNLLETSGIYQFPLAKYHKTTSSITLVDFERSIIKSGAKLGNEALTKANGISLKSITASAIFSNGSSTTTLYATLDLTNFRENSLVVLTFESYDPYGYSAEGIIYGTAVFTYSRDLIMSYMRPILVSSSSSGGTVVGSIGPLSGKKLPITFPLSGGPGRVQATCYYVE